MPLTSPAFPPGRTASSIANSSSSPTAPIPTRCARSCRSRWRSPSRWSSSSSSACPTRPASATTPRAGQVIPVRFEGEHGGYVHACSWTTSRRSPAGASCGAFRRSSRRRAHASRRTRCSARSLRQRAIAVATMGYKHRALDLATVKASLMAPNFLLKIIPHVDGTPRICELVALLLRGRHRQGRLERPGGAAALPSRARARGELPVLEVLSGVHILADLTLGLGTVVHDYLD